MDARIPPDAHQRPSIEPPLLSVEPGLESNYLTPCPLSPNYRVPAHQAWRSLSLFVAYRVALGLSLAIPIGSGRMDAFLSVSDPGLFARCATVYLLSALAGVPLVLIRRPVLGIQVHLQVLLDIGLIAVMMRATGGVASGLGILIACSVAAGGILAGGRCAFGFAAVASIAVLLQEWALALGAMPSPMSSTSAGLLGAAFFAIALLAIALSRRAEQSETLAARHRHDLENLRRLNAFIVDHLQTGIVVLDGRGQIHMTNPAARRLLGAAPTIASVSDLGIAFQDAYRAWPAQDCEVSTNLASAAGHALHVRFARVLQAEPVLSMALIEDSALHKQRVQQSKLRSLGRLTGSIAHEIRNPLGAIQHAAQLLRESSGLSPDDQRLLDIVLRHAHRVNRIVENIMQISSGRATQREVIDLHAWIERFLKDFCEERGLSNASFRLSSAKRRLSVLADASHLRQIMDNLCANAIKYGKPERGAIDVRIDANPQDGHPYIAVRDHGGGIDGASADSIFEPFFTTSRSGMGLGLYIARELAELNQAHIEFRPSADGSEFRITLADGQRTAL